MSSSFQSICHRENGNVLFIILLAVVLIGLLTAAISASNNSENANIDGETLLIRASEIKSYGAELERAVNYILQDGYSESDIRFAHPDADVAYGDITDNPSRQVFDVDGGGATYRVPPSDIQAIATDWIFTASNHVNGIGVTPTVSDEAQGTELIALLMNVTKDFCLALNNANNIENPSSEPPSNGAEFSYGDLFTGGFAFKETLGGATQTQGAREACIEGNTDPAAGTYHYYRVLLTR